MNSREIPEKINESFGVYGGIILLGAVALIFISNLGNDSDEETMVAPSGYSAYPDAVTNANVIIGQVNDHTTAEIKNLGNELNDNINNSTESVLEKIDTSTDSITNKIETATDDIKKSQTDSTKTLTDIINANQQAYNKISNENVILKHQLQREKRIKREMNEKAIQDLKSKNSVIKGLKKQVKSLRKSLKNSKKGKGKTKARDKLVNTVTSSSFGGGKVTARIGR